MLTVSWLLGPASLERPCPTFRGQQQVMLLNNSKVGHSYEVEGRVYVVYYDKAGYAE